LSDVFAVGDIFNQRYRLLEELGSGGIGTVFRALQIDANREIALKILSPGQAVDEDSRERFVREARALSRLNHANIVTVYHFGISESGLPFIAMELIIGDSIRCLLNRDGPLPALKAVKIARQIAGALAYVHENGIIHRDLKPDNIIMVETPEPDTPKLIDFGLARLQGEQKLTGEGMLIGSVNYMSPEQCQGIQLDRRTDLYALSVCLFEMLTDTKPFNADNPVGLMYKQIHEPAPAITADQVDRFDSGINELLQKGMAKHPDQRYQNMNEFAAALARLYGILEKVKPSKQAPSAAKQGKEGQRPLSLIAGVTAALLLALIVGVSSKVSLDLLSRNNNAGSSQKKTSEIADLNPDLSHKWITASLAAAAIKKAITADSLYGSGAGLTLISNYLKSDRLDSRARCLFLLKRAAYEDEQGQKVEYLEKAYRLAAADFQRKVGSNGQELYACCAGAYAQGLLDSGRFDEAISVCRSMLESCKKSIDFDKSVYMNEEQIAGPCDFLSIEAAAALKAGKSKLSASLCDELSTVAYGGSRRAVQVTGVLLELGRSGDISRQIHLLSDMYSVKDPLLLSRSLNDEYEAVVRYEALTRMAAECSARRQWDLAEFCLVRAETISKKVLSGVQEHAYTSLHVELEKCNLCFLKGQTQSGKEQLLELGNRWLNDNNPESDSKKHRFFKVNPLPLLFLLMEKDMRQEAERILTVVNGSILEYAPDLRPSFNETKGYAENRINLLCRLKAYESDRLVQSLLTQVSALPARLPERR
jgi:serine/threonine protein kinase